MKQKTIVTILGFLLYCVFFVLAWMNGLAKFYGPDIVFSLILILFLRLTFDFWRLNVPVYTLVILSFASHLMGIFGWYSASPLPLSWDRITHVFPMFAFTVLFYNFARQWMPNRFWKAQTWGVIVLILLAGLGVGAMVENIEFGGFLLLGFGEGAFFLGGPGDGIPHIVELDEEQQNALLEAGGGYFNTEFDLVWNALGALAAIVLMSIVHFAMKPEL